MVINIVQEAIFTILARALIDSTLASMALNLLRGKLRWRDMRICALEKLLSVDRFDVDRFNVVELGEGALRNEMRELQKGIAHT